MNRFCFSNVYLILGIFILTYLATYAQTPIRVGTTSADFLEIGYGPAGQAMGDAYVSMANNVSSAYWNPAGLGYMTHDEVMFDYQPWIVGINTSFLAAGINVGAIGKFAVSLINVNYGQMEVTTLQNQEGTGETFTPTDLAFGISYARKITEWFSSGITAKYISSNIWHETASAFALDLGVILNTAFFSPTGNRAQGLKIGMSISNYGTRMQYNGLDLTQPIDILPNQAGNYQWVPGQFTLQSWELPLIMRIGVSIQPIYTSENHVSLEIDALHPNNNSESLNIGGQYSLILPSFGEVHIRTGYKALFMPDSEFGLTFGIGLTKYLLNNMGIKIGYAYRAMGIFGGINSYSVSLIF